MSDCVFCDIVSGGIDAHVVFENDQALAFLDANPLVDGHTVIVPKKHVERFSEMPREVIGGTFSAVREVNKSILSGLGADGANLGLNDGKAAGQAIPHTHVHVIPRYDGDGGGSLHSIISGEASEDLEKVAEKLKSAI
ncbi:MAG: HIT family protein [Candidatus Bipolaricaulota bacterium]|nr:HIT family protein [Candidatus Bipolaricaulota bacterium]MBS3791918.1 HIT family protein [Candidatus Bipolaricaulota bacterium]